MAFIRASALRHHNRAAVLCTSMGAPGAFAHDSTSMGQTVTQMPQPMQELLALVMGSCLSAYCITSSPTWQFREHSMQAMHFSLEWIANRLTRNRVNAALKICIILASGHQ